MTERLTLSLTLSPQNISKSVIKNFVRECLLSVQTTMILSIIFIVLCSCSSASPSPSPRGWCGSTSPGLPDPRWSVHSVHLQGQAPGMQSQLRQLLLLCLHPGLGAFCLTLLCHVIYIILWKREWGPRAGHPRLSAHSGMREAYQKPGKQTERKASQKAQTQTKPNRKLCGEVDSVDWRCIQY